jgi:hypothetical protein
MPRPIRMTGKLSCPSTWRFSDHSKGGSVIEREEHCIVAFAEILRGSGEILVSPFGDVPRKATLLARATFEPDLVLSDGEAMALDAEGRVESWLPFRFIFDLLSAFRNAFKIPELRGKILFTVAIIAIYRLGANVPVPGIDHSAVAQLVERGFVIVGVEPKDRDLGWCHLRHGVAHISLDPVQAFRRVARLNQAFPNFHEGQWAKVCGRGGHAPPP